MSKGAALASRKPLVVAILIVVAAASPAEVAASSEDYQNLHRAIDYLRDTAYSPDLRLCREAPRVAPNVYWVASDNLLAFKALEPYDPELASTIRSELVRIAQLYNLPTSRDGVPLSLRYDVIMRDDETLEIPPRDITHITLYNGSYLLRYDVANGSGRFEDWRKYADLPLLVALSNHNRGDHANAISNFTSAADMWDGMGLRDEAYQLAYGEGQAQGTPNAYATYKLGLLLYVSGKLGLRILYCMSLSHDDLLYCRVLSCVDSLPIGHRFSLIQLSLKQARGKDSVHPAIPFVESAWKKDRSSKSEILSNGTLKIG